MPPPPAASSCAALAGLVVVPFDAARRLGPRGAAPAGPFRPTWEVLAAYMAPDWFRDAKFGVWAHLGPQWQPERGNWYARKMYLQGNPIHEHHRPLPTPSHTPR